MYKIAALHNFGAMKAPLLATLLFTASPVLAQATSTPSSPPSLLASAVVAGLVSAAVSGVISLLVKDKEYKNEYYKKVIEKRLEAIEAAEKLSALTAPIYYTNKNEPYHAIIDDDKDNIIFNKLMDESGMYNTWYTYDTVEAFSELAHSIQSLLQECKGKDKSQRQAIAVRSLDGINVLSRKLEIRIRTDMASLHKVKKFFRKMRRDNRIKELLA